MPGQKGKTTKGTARRIRTAKPLKIKYAPRGNAVTSPDAVVELFRSEQSYDRECLWVLHLDAQHAVTQKEMVAMGNLNTCAIHPREVFRRAVINNSGALITVHNHPSGVSQPSDNYVKFWENIDAAGELLDIRALDHIIVTPTGNYYSYRSNMIYRGVTPSFITDAPAGGVN